jgi:hypothetical protein
LAWGAFLFQTFVSFNPINHLHLLLSKILVRMKTFYALLFTVLSFAAQAQTIYYVNSQIGDDALDGLSASITAESGPKASIQAAINASAEGDVLSIEAGNYSENVILDRNLVFVKTGSAQVSATSFTFSFGARLLEALPAANAFSVPLVTVNQGSLIGNGINLVAVNGTLVVNDGDYEESVFLSKSFDLLINSSATVNDLILTGQGVKVTLSGRLITRNSVQFNRPEGGWLDLSSGDLVVLPDAVIYPGNAASYAIASGSGRFRAVLNAEGTVFPVGTSTTYAPVTISGLDSGSETVDVGVRSAGNPQSFNPWLPDQVNSHIYLQWFLTSTITQSASIRFDYTGSAQPENWNEVQNRLVAVSVNNADFNPASNSFIGDAYASADNSPNGLFAVYSDFPNSIELPASAEYAVYPNPFLNQLNIKTQNTSNELFSVRLTDLSGRMVYNNQLYCNNGNLVLNDLQHIASGYYMLTLENAGSRYSVAVVK